MLRRTVALRWGHITTRRYGSDNYQHVPLAVGAGTFLSRVLTSATPCCLSHSLRDDYIECSYDISRGEPQQGYGHDGKG